MGVFYFGENNEAKLPKEIYYGINNTSKLVKKVYFGINGRSKLVYTRKAYLDYQNYEIKNIYLKNNKKTKYRVDNLEKEGIEIYADNFGYPPFNIYTESSKIYIIKKDNGWHRLFLHNNNYTAINVSDIILSNIEYAFQFLSNRKIIGNASNLSFKKGTNFYQLYYNCNYYGYGNVKFTYPLNRFYRVFDNSNFEHININFYYPFNLEYPYIYGQEFAKDSKFNSITCFINNAWFSQGFLSNCIFNSINIKIENSHGLPDFCGGCTCNNVNIDFKMTDNCNLYTAFHGSQFAGKIFFNFNIYKMNEVNLTWVFGSREFNLNALYVLISESYENWFREDIKNNTFDFDPYENRSYSWSNIYTNIPGEAEFYNGIYSPELNIYILEKSIQE